MTCMIAIGVATACWGASSAPEGGLLVVPEFVGQQHIQRLLYLQPQEKLQLPCRLTGKDMVWQKLVGKQVEGRPLRYVRVWVKPEATGGAQILGRRTIEFRDMGVELHWPRITQRSVEYHGRTIQVPQRAEGPREKWGLVAKVRKAGTYAVGCDLGPAAKFSRRRVTWTAELHRWAYEPLAGLGDLSRPASHRFVVLYAVLDLQTTDAVAKEGEVVELTPTCQLREDTGPGAFMLYRVAALWQETKKSFVHAPAYPGTSYWAPTTNKSLRNPHLTLWLFPRKRYQVILVWIFGLEDGYGPLSTSALLRSRVLDYRSRENVIDFLAASSFGHSATRPEASGPVWQCAISPALTSIEPDGKISPVDKFAAELALWAGERPSDRAVPNSLDEAVSWDEELMWSGGARVALVGIVTGEIPPEQMTWYQRWVQRVHELGYKAAVAWNCVEVFPTDYTYKTRPYLLAKTADGKDIPAPSLGFHGAVLNWLCEDWQKWAGETAKQFLSKIGFDYIYLDWTPIDNVSYHYLLAPVSGTMVDYSRRTSLSTGNPGEFTHIAAAFRGRIFRFGNTEVRRFADYTAPPLGHGFFSWNRAMTESAGWVNAPYPTKAAAFERWCQMATMRMAYPGLASIWSDRTVSGVYCYLGEPGMRVMRTYADLVRRLEKESWGVCMDLPVTTSNGVPAYARLFFPTAWARGRFYLLVAADRDTTAKVSLPMIQDRYMVCDLLTMRIWSTQGDLQVEISHKDNLFYPSGGLRPLLVQRLR